MNEAEVVYRPEAIDDLEHIFRSILKLSLDRATARAYVARIRERCRRIGNVPKGGSIRDDLEPGLRTVPFERRAVIAYRLNDERVEITNIFYGGQDFEAIYRARRTSEDEFPTETH
ncbi:type II toxin-antitoxin system RelE/ParE family toxin [Sphingobium sp. BS19]|uniref:type II toxin-antitoxin system RelE/ParE family toxin n=1 Tax=Sphingobium sp. BS19 TaxID=3018973 RepID=UPI0022ED5A7F|nr:type II toxin-antitoxin system RelE/ParE family toxin [Sphingobium sp. BS19]GLI98186.1 plasmid stabilization protein [Sphingobium sp. BS19]